MRSATVVLSVVMALAAGAAAAAESKVAKKFDAGPAIQGNSDPAVPMNKPMHKKATKHRARKAM